MPHIVPCPAPRVKYADSDIEVMEDGRRRRRRRTTDAPIDESFGAERAAQTSLYISEKEKDRMRKKAHECPVPKPPGVIGRILGFNVEDREEERPRPRVVTQTATEAREHDT